MGQKHLWVFSKLSVYG